MSSFLSFIAALHRIPVYNRFSITRGITILFYNFDLFANTIHHSCFEYVFSRLSICCALHYISNVMQAHWSDSRHIQGLASSYLYLALGFSYLYLDVGPIPRLAAAEV